MKISTFIKILGFLFITITLLLLFFKKEETLIDYSDQEADYEEVDEHQALLAGIPFSSFSILLEEEHSSNQEKPSLSDSPIGSLPVFPKVSTTTEDGSLLSPTTSIHSPYSTEDLHASQTEGCGLRHTRSSKNMNVRITSSSALSSMAMSRSMTSIPSESASLSANNSIDISIAKSPANENTPLLSQTKSHPQTTKNAVLRAYLVILRALKNKNVFIFLCLYGVDPDIDWVLAHPSYWHLPLRVYKHIQAH